MYKKAVTKEMLDEFHRIKEKSWSLKGFGMELVKEKSDAFLFYPESKTGETYQASGTFEFTPYSDTTRDMMKDLFKDVINKDMKVVEIDSFSVLPEFRGKLGREIICFMIDYAERHNYSHAIGIADPSVFRSFNETYHIPTEQVKDTFWYKGEYVVPALFNLKEVYTNKENKQYSWYKRPTELIEKVGA